MIVVAAIFLAVLVLTLAVLPLILSSQISQEERDEYGEDDH